MSDLELRVYYEDTDSGGVVYYANYLKFIERGRSEFLRELGFEQDQLINDQGVIFAVRSLQAEYLSPARFNDLLTIHTQVEKSRRASLIFSQKIRDLKQNKVLFEAQVTVACLDVQNFKPRAIPSDILEKINGQ
ncbi:tol-pal system-associated acyl-CoA thioesterase [Candidatus Thioglobus sp.]|jgi:acyl-CoA thioester hydrolase|uniref:tol-pal system-associated acyl-CoA thioesterase n=1 Tax=Candidatus Thioglobus sp. TaxID=2026721 RepID=UPI001D7FA10D|nr:tol-pal system-associated acyl-CoA thioesterase [Candidatus Thioglobus sp.]MBT3276583.1 tol-pal system-associated acyl-CoA thioesterase [Candidatus Thioglobus sp.]MBT3446686.1 tol-pal system-associated acyl-CoA thioesterase [Candidatus Thioglobus sp.]MBT3745321.1 tol-pal system-associated acyl-CoA thioesterase [Candidatus Thioglobus sp.]MBT4001340.1 tol-pal system-associated acyl-CoA thioesterase [Candidatus Thioglobus sp.]MBT4182030.1 tol-pal system-associated acyl-CoA thioesterase [Candid